MKRSEPTPAEAVEAVSAMTPPPGAARTAVDLENLDAAESQLPIDPVARAR